MEIKSLFKRLMGNNKKEEDNTSSFFPPQSVTYSSFSVQGRKAKQEDDCLIWHDNKDSVVIVADGVGSHGHGDFASYVTCHEVFERRLNTMGVGVDPAQFLRDTCYCAAQEVYKKSTSDPEFKNCGTTLTGFVYRKDVGYWTINVGDSRVYLIKPSEKQVRQLTEDQTSDSSTRKMKYAIGQPPDYLRPHIEVYAWDEEQDLLRPGDALMAVSDGVCEPFEIPSEANPNIYTDKSEFWEFLCNLQYDEKCAERIVNNSFNAGSGDNITCAIMAMGK